jgi:protoporphyrinogen oxidase
MSTPVVEIGHNGKEVTSVSLAREGRIEKTGARDVVSTVPIDTMVHLLRPAAPPEVIEAADRLRYRDMVIVFLALDRAQVTPDNWIYFPTSEVFFGRMHKPKNWSGAMAPEGKTSLVVEIFCFEKDPVFTERDDQLAGRVARQLAEMKLIEERQVTGSCVVRLRKAYPLYVLDYRGLMGTVLNYLRG